PDVSTLSLHDALPICLGLHYMRMGREDDARKVLEKAFEMDEFNIQVSNTLKVLDHLDKYQTMKTKHFHLRYDPKNDKVLANFMGDRKSTRLNSSHSQI